MPKATETEIRAALRALLADRNFLEIGLVLQDEAQKKAKQDAVAGLPPAAFAVNDAKWDALKAFLAAGTGDGLTDPQAAFLDAQAHLLADEKQQFVTSLLVLYKTCRRMAAELP